MHTNSNTPAAPPPAPLPPRPDTIPDPRYEAFAFALARGELPICAYHQAGLSSPNPFELSLELSREPRIVARVEHLRACLPHIEQMRARFAPNLLLMPETKDEMLAWLWQVMNGTRKILPLQLRAATLFTRLNGWHLKPRSASASASAQVGQEQPTRPDNQHPYPAHSHAPAQADAPAEGQGQGQGQGQSQGQAQAPAYTSTPSPLPICTPTPVPAVPAPVPAQLTTVERCILARHSRDTVQADAAFSVLKNTVVTRFESNMADLALHAAFQFPTTRPVPWSTQIQAASAECALAIKNLAPSTPNAIPTTAANDCPRIPHPDAPSSPEPLGFRSVVPHSCGGSPRRTPEAPSSQLRVPHSESQTPNCPPTRIHVPPRTPRPLKAARRPAATQ